MVSIKFYSGKYLNRRRIKYTGNARHYVNNKVLYKLYIRMLPGTADPSGRSLAGIVGSNPFGDVDVSVVSVVCRQVEVSASR